MTKWKWSTPLLVMTWIRRLKTTSCFTNKKLPALVQTEMGVWLIVVNHPAFFFCKKNKLYLWLFMCNLLYISNLLLTLDSTWVFFLTLLNVKVVEVRGLVFEDINKAFLYVKTESTTFLTRVASMTNVRSYSLSKSSRKHATVFIRLRARTSRATIASFPWSLLLVVSFPTHNHKHLENTIINIIINTIIYRKHNYQATTNQYQQQPSKQATTKLCLLLLARIYFPSAMITDLSQI
jgi:hypothetical protein